MRIINDRRKPLRVEWRSEPLKFTGPLPKFIGPSFRAVLLFPQKVSTFSQMLLVCPVPIFLRSATLAAILLPEKVSAFTDHLVEAEFCLGEYPAIIAKLR